MEYLVVQHGVIDLVVMTEINRLQLLEVAILQR
jgi:hypothetical protein